MTIATSSVYKHRDLSVTRQLWPFENLASCGSETVGDRIEIPHYRRGAAASALEKLSIVQGRQVRLDSPQAKGTILLYQGCED